MSRDIQLVSFPRPPEWWTSLLTLRQALVDTIREACRTLHIVVLTTSLPLTQPQYEPQHAFGFGWPSRPLGGPCGWQQLHVPHMF